jgi:ribonuclease BN (tRNA processing enzyme)
METCCNLSFSYFLLMFEFERVLFFFCSGHEQTNLLEFENSFHRNIEKDGKKFTFSSLHFYCVWF